ncbi:hypothetical protein [Bradyrhizobium uaiense]|nr:hypothetical protein [Bradyrhizobium uaiense]
MKSSLIGTAANLVSPHASMIRRRKRTADFNLQMRQILTQDLELANERGHAEITMIAARISLAEIDGHLAGITG